MRPRAGLLLVLAGTLLLSACAPRIQDTVLPGRIDYVCGGNRTLPVARDGNAALVLINGQEVRLMRTESAAQEKYVNGGLALYLDGERAMLETEGRVLLGPCDSPVRLPTAPRIQ